MQSEIGNAGTGTVTAPFCGQYWLPNDTTFGEADDQLLNTYDYQGGVPGNWTSSGFTVYFAVPSTVPSGYAENGKVYTAMKTDSSNQIVENDEADNFGQIDQGSDWNSFTVKPDDTPHRSRHPGPDRCLRYCSYRDHHWSVEDGQPHQRHHPHLPVDLGE